MTELEQAPIPTPREAMGYAVAYATAERWHGAHVWAQIARELREGDSHRAQGGVPSADPDSFRPGEVDALTRPLRGLPAKYLFDDREAEPTEGDKQAHPGTERFAHVPSRADAADTLVRPFVERQTSCENCGGELLYSSVSDAQAPPKWLHRSNYQTVCPTTNPAAGHRFARPKPTQQGESL